MSQDGNTALLYGYPPEGDVPILLEDPTTATAGEPTIRVAIANHPIHGFPPTLILFLPSAATT
jgi:hypothetical protein